MIIELSVENFRSIKTRQTFSLVQAKSQELADNTFNVDAPGVGRLLNSAAIYGANAAGKSNFIRAIRVMRDIVQDSASTQRGNKLPVTPFRLSDDTVNAPTEFEVLFVANGVKYQYGFTTTQNQIMEEWLLSDKQLTSA